jgi:GT2 family glycosyltransferase
MNRVAIVVLNWNGIEDTLQCLQSLKSQTYPDFKIIVVDNGSIDNSKELLEKYKIESDNSIEIIYNSKNRGFAGGVNTGISWALTNDFTYVALFNNDAIADINWLKILVDGVQPEEIGISTGLLLHRDGKTIDSSGDWLSSWGLPFPRSRGNSRDKAPESSFVFGASGGASLYKLSMIKRIGLFDEDFFAYYEDADFSFRAQLAGWKVIYSPRAIAYHKQGATSNKIPGFAIYQTFKNLPLLFIKDIPNGLRLKVGIKFYFAYFLILFNAIAKGNGRPALKGAWMSFILGFKKLKERKEIQKNKKVSNQYIESIFWNDLPPDQTGIRKLRHFFIRK